MPGPPPDPSLRRSVRRAVAWRSGGQLLVQGVSWAVTIVVIRLLAPADYGLMALAQLVIGLLFTLGGQNLASALIQATEVTPGDVRRLFGAALALNLALGALQFITADAVAAFYRAPPVADLLRWMALAYPLAALIAVPTALASRRLDFKRQATVDLAGTLAGAAATLAVALNGGGVWALVAGQLATSTVRALLYALVTPWLVLPSFRLGEAGAMLRFGGQLTLNALLFYAYSQSAVLVGARLTSVTEIGLYTTAFFLASLPVARFVPLLNDVGFAAYARLKDDPPALAAAFLKATRVIAVATFPLYLGLAAVAPDFTAAVLGAQWRDAAVPLALVALAMPVYTLYNLFWPPAYALGRATIQTRISLAALALMPPAFAFGALGLGGEGLAWAWLLAFPAVFAFAAALTLPLIGVRAAELARAALPPLAAAAPMAVIVAALPAALPALAPAPRLALAIALGALLYGAFARLVARRALADATDLIRR